MLCLLLLLQLHGALCVRSGSRRGRMSGPLAAENSVLQLKSPAVLAVTYATKAACVEEWFRRECTGEEALGFDTETRPAYRKGEVYPPATLQLSTAGACLVVHLSRFDGKKLPSAIIDALASRDVLKVGVGIDDDAIDLWLHHGLEVNGRRDLAAISSKPRVGHMKSLRTLTEELLGVRLEKSSSLTLTDWAKRQLSGPELSYAALDAWAGRACYDGMRQRASAGDDAGGAPVIERSCAELYAYRRVRHSIRRSFAELEKELSEHGLPSDPRPESAAGKRRAAEVRRTVAGAKRQAAALFAASARDGGASNDVGNTAGGGGGSATRVVSSTKTRAKADEAERAQERKVAEAEARTRRLELARAAESAQEQARAAALQRREELRAQRKWERNLENET